MKDEFFDHIKHRLAETPVPDPEQGWQQMNMLLDAKGVPLKSTIRSLQSIRSLHWWQAAACLLLASGVWAFYHEWPNIHHGQVANTRLIRRTPSAQTLAPQPPAAGDRGTAPGNGTSGSMTSGSETPGNMALGNLAPGNGVSGSMAPDNGTSGNMALGNLTPGNGDPGSVAAENGTSGNGMTGRQAYANRAQNDRAPGNQVQGNRIARGNQIRTGSSQTENTGLVQEQENPLFPTGTTGLSDPTANFNDLSTTLADGTFLLDRPIASPLAGNRRSVAGAADLVHIRGPQHLSKWSLNIGLAANTPGSFTKIRNNNQTKWEAGVYPVAVLWYRLSPRWSLGLGLAAPAPIGYSNTPTRTNEYVAADSLQNVAQTTTSQRLAMLTYLDIPLTMKFELFSHLTIEAGIQASYLLSQQNETNSVNKDVRGLVVLDNSVNIYYPVNHDPLHARVMKIDPRALLGLNYQFHRFNAGLQYEGGLRAAVNQTDNEGNPISERTSVMRMMIGYRLN
jgi:hypothetical protein